MEKRKPFSGQSGCQNSFSFIMTGLKPKVFFLCLFLVLTTIPVKCETEALDYRIVSYEDLLPGLQQFFEDGVVHFDELLFDTAHHQLIVGKD